MAKRIDNDRAGGAAARRVDLYAKLTECLTEEDVEKFYIQLMKLVELGDRDALRMFKDLVWPKEHKHTTGGKLPILSDVGERELIDGILSRYLPAARRTVVDQPPIALPPPESTGGDLPHQ